MNHLLFTTSPLLQLHSKEHLFLLLQYPFVLCWQYLDYLQEMLSGKTMIQV